MNVFGLNWKWHLGYWAVLILVASLGMWQLRQSGLVKNEIGRVQEPTLEQLRYLEIVSQNETIETILSAYFAHSQMDSTVKQTIKLGKKLDEKGDRFLEGLHRGTPPGDAGRSAGFLENYYQLGDSLAGLKGIDAPSRAWIDRCLYSALSAYSPEQMAEMLANADTADASRLYRNLRLRAGLAQVFTLNSLHKKMQEKELRFDGFTPGFFYENCPRAGVPFEADICLLSYTRSSQNLAIRVNGEPVPMDAGLAHYNAVFKHPGTHTVPVEITVRNPLTGEDRIYQKDFKVEVTEGFGQ